MSGNADPLEGTVSEDTTTTAVLAVVQATQESTSGVASTAILALVLG